MMDELSFLKQNIIQSRQNDKSGKNALKLIKVDKQNEFLFQKNIAAFIELIDFLKGRDDVFVVSGFPLCGKSLLTSIIPQMVTEKTIFYSFYCTEASTIDDLLLGFFETIKVYAQKKLVYLPKIDTKNFQERINIYLTKCENPIIISLDGLDKIANNKNKDEIMQFLSHVVNKENIKLIISTRAFDVSDLKNINLRLDTVIIKPFTEQDLKEYCLSNVINPEGIEDFYKISRGHNLNLFLTMNYLQPTNLTIKEFLVEVETAKKSLNELIISKNLSLIPSSYDNLLWIISLSDFGMPISNLLSVPESNEDQIIFLLKKGIIESYNGCVYLKDYFKTDILKEIEPLAKINIIKGIVKFLEAQLPLKPSIREIKLSRVTIRNEIDRLNAILNKTNEKKADKTKASYMTILGYSRQFKTNWDGFDEIIMPKSERSKDEEIDVQTFENQESDDVVIQDNDFEIPEKNNSALNFAKMLKNKYNYADALIEYADALETALNENNPRLVIDILKDIAECYFKLGDYQNAIENYGKAHEVAKNENLIDICYEIMLEIAEVYKSTYKKDLALEIYKDIIFVDNISEKIKLTAELNLFELNFAKLKPNEIFKKYFELLEKTEDKEIKAKIYFRLGFLYDKASSIENAINYYKLSIETCDNQEVNENLSSCYYNLAQIYYYQKDYDEALPLYFKSLAIDEIKKNTDGMLLTTKRIAKTYEKKKSDLAQKYYEKALDIAKVMKDNYPVACAIIDLGDYYYRKKEDMTALKVYLSAIKVLSNQLTNENEMAIKDRINDLKIRMGKDVVDSVIKGFS